MPKKAKTVEKTEEAVQEEVQVVQSAEVQTEAPSVQDTPAKEEVKKETPKKEKTSGPKAKTMEELLAKTGYKLKAPKKGDIVEGKVTALNRRVVQVDIDGKTEGIVTDKEYENAVDFIERLSVGDTVSVYILSAENERGQILLSLKKAAMDQKWDVFKRSLDNGEPITVRGVELNKGGMIVVFEGIRGFVPTSQFGKAVANNLESLLNKTFKVKAIEVDREKNRLIFSERHISEEALMKQKSAALDVITEGAIYDGVVSAILPFGVFVTLTIPMEEEAKGHIEGLVHISEISWEKVEDPNKYVTVGQQTKVKVLGIDQTAGKLNLSIKQTLDDPWAIAKDKYPEGTVVSGVVSRVAQFGIFVHLEAGIDGLVHISKITDMEMPRVGEDVTVSVENVDPEARRMSLSLTPTEVPIGYK